MRIEDFVETMPRCGGAIRFASDQISSPKLAVRERQAQNPSGSEHSSSIDQKRLGLRQVQVLQGVG